MVEVLLVVATSILSYSGPVSLIIYAVIGLTSGIGSGCCGVEACRGAVGCTVSVRSTISLVVGTAGVSRPRSGDSTFGHGGFSAAPVTSSGSIGRTTVYLCKSVAYVGNANDERYSEAKLGVLAVDIEIASMKVRRRI